MGTGLLPHQDAVRAFGQSSLNGRSLGFQFPR
jgi:hypothetical protein